ncbi:MAG: hypothetical protein K6E51_04600 [Treponema sp.]|nr:hypothetical protein [Treponema sp.]
MKQSNWYIKLPYNQNDILIPYTVIAESNVQSGDDVTGNLTTISLDDFAASCNITAPDTQTKCILRTKGSTPFFITTSAIPQIQQLSFHSIQSIEGIIGKKLRSHGICGFRFENDKLQYELDIQYLVKKGSEKPI